MIQTSEVICGMNPHDPASIDPLLVGGWATPLKNMKVNWDDEIPNIWKNKKWQPNHQPDYYWILLVMLMDNIESAMETIIGDYSICSILLLMILLLVMKCLNNHYWKLLEIIGNYW